MPERKSVLVLPGNDIDVPLSTWVGRSVTNIYEYWERWNKPLLNSSEPVQVVVSVPSLAWSGMNHNAKQVWNSVKNALCALFSWMKGFELEVHGPVDLTEYDGGVAVQKATDLLLNNEQVLGAAHVPRPQDKEEHYFEIGQGGKLNESIIREVGARLRQQPWREHRAIIVGCTLLKTQLPSAFINEGLACVFLATRDEWFLDDALNLLISILVSGYDEPGCTTLNKMWATYHKIRGFPHTAAESLYGVKVDWDGVKVESCLILEGSPVCPNGEPRYYMACVAEEGGGLLSEHVWKNLGLFGKREDVLEMVAKLGGEDRVLIVDAPPNLRRKVADVLKKKPVLWVAFGATCASVGKSVVRSDIEKYHIGYARTSSRNLVFELLADHYTCLSVQGMRPKELEQKVAKIPGGELGAEEFRDFVLGLVTGGQDRLVVGERPG